MDPLGVAVIVAVLIVATTFGLWRRRTDGIIRDEAAEKKRRRNILEAAGLEVVEIPDHSSPTAVAAAAAKAASTAAAAAVHAPVVVPDREEEPGVLSAEAERLAPGLLERLGVGPAQVTLLQFSSAFCAPCRAVRRISSEVAELVPGVQHVEVDAESHLDEVRELAVWRTPTLLILDAEGRVAKRATGVPSKPQLIAAIGELIPDR
ncbi:TlpA family protein disulfide reductase [Paractinoplanes rhizophilus]|uniref:TlpA family protein disulfide reductase n=1 Tax=Paractinoplanes rhizophilus TaxID=1416877 RepID=A0ABW2HJI6_9ACTN|nr:thioredoxin family protein [Actinoplanes sp.]